MYDINKYYQVRVKAVFDGKVWKVNLPHYQMVPGSWQPLTPALIDKDGVLVGADPVVVQALNPTVAVIVPDRMCDSNGNLSAKKIVALHPDIAIYADPNFLASILP